MTDVSRPVRLPMTGPDSWDQRYAGGEYSFGTAPSAYLAARRHLFQAGMAVLVPGDGEGRNGVFVAEQGARVTSVDYAPAGVAKAMRLAAVRDVEIEGVCADLTTWAWPVAAYDAVVAIYFHMPPRHREALHRAMAASLKPGGFVLIEGYSLAQIALQKTEDSGGPSDPTMLFTADLLRQDFADLVVQELLETETILDEGVYHRGRAAVMRFIARKA